VSSSNSATAGLSVHRLVTDLVEMRAELAPDRVAYRFSSDGEFDTCTVTYGALREQSRSVARRLRQNVVTGDRVIVALPPGLEFVSHFFGCLYAGAVAVPAYPPLRLRHQPSIERFARIVKDSSAAAVLTTPALAAGLRNAHFDFLLGVAVLGCDPAEYEDGKCGSGEFPRREGDEPAVLQYTSGSTSMPRGVVLTNAGILYNLKVTADLFGSSEDSVGVIWLPPYHDMGLIGGILQPLFGGFPVILFSPFRFVQQPLRWLKTISRWKGTVSGGPNFAYELCIRKISSEQRAELDLSSWKVAFNGAEPIRSETLERFAVKFRPCGFHREAFFPCYGLAEATLLVTGKVKDRASSSAPYRSVVLQEARTDIETRRGAMAVGVGRAAPGTTVVIADPETRHALPDGAIGEIWVSAPGVGAGYWNRPLENERVFEAQLANTGEGPFLRTGDLGFLDSGELFVTGRLKDIIIIRGLKYWPHDIESIAESVDPCLRAAAAFTEGDGVECSLTVMAEWDGEVDRDQCSKIEAAIRSVVAEQIDLRVDRVVLVAPGSIPRTTSGKIQRHRCRGWLRHKEAGSLLALQRLTMGEASAGPEA